MPPTIGDASALVLTLLLPTPFSSRSRFLRAAKSLSESLTFEGCGGEGGAVGEGERGTGGSGGIEVGSSCVCVRVDVVVGVRTPGIGVVCCRGGVDGREGEMVYSRGVVSF